MNKNNNLLYLMIAILAAAMGYFYISKTNPEFFNDLMKKINHQSDSGLPDDMPQEKEIFKDKEIPTDEVEPKTDEPKVSPPTDDELLPPDDVTPRRRRR